MGSIWSNGLYWEKIGSIDNKAKQKDMCVSGYMLLKIRVGRSDYFFFIFCNNFVSLKYFL